MEMIFLFFSLFVILSISLIPVALFRRSAKEVLLVGFSVIAFLFFYRKYFLGITSAYHDTFWGFESYFRLMRQWADSGFAPGWNPYMNGGEPIYLFSNGFLCTPLLLFVFLGHFFKGVASHLLFNHAFILLFLNLCIGAFLLFMTLFEDFKVAFFCFLCLLLGGCFDVILGQPAGILVLYYFPYILFGVLTSLKGKNPYGIVLALVYAGLSVNYYLPIYVFLVIFFLLAFFFCSNPEYGRTLIYIVKRHYKILAVGTILAFLAASPAIFLKLELNSFVFPTRGSLARGGAINAEQTGLQLRVNAPLRGYKIFIERVLKDQYGGIHHAFYFGVFAFFLALLALLKSREMWPKILFLTASLAGIIGTGAHFLLPFLYNFVPGFSLIRHMCFFAPFVSFLFICMAGYGLKLILVHEKKDRSGIILYVFFCSALLLFITHDVISLFLIFTGLLAVLFSIILSGRLMNNVSLKPVVYVPIFVVLVFDLGYFNMVSQTYTHNAGDNRGSLAPSADLPEPFAFRYPESRHLYASGAWPMPVDLYPLFFKEASLLSSKGEGYTFFRNARLHDMLQQVKKKGESRAFGVNGPLVYFTNNVKILEPEERKEEVIRKIFDDFDKNKNPEGPHVFFKKDEIDFAESNGPRGSSYPGNIRFTETGDPNRVGLEIETPTDGYLVRLENFHSGWKGTLDGVTIKVYPANFAFQAIRVPAGKHKVIFEFKTIYPCLFWLYVLISVSAWVLLNRYLLYLNATIKGAKKT